MCKKLQCNLLLTDCFACLGLTNFSDDKYSFDAMKKIFFLNLINSKNEL